MSGSFLFAVMKQSFSVQTSDEFAVVGNALALICNVPAFVRDHITVVSWQRSDGLIFDRRTDLQGNVCVLRLRTCAKCDSFIAER